MNDTEFHIRIQAALPDRLPLIEEIYPALIKDIKRISVPGIKGCHGLLLHALQIEGQLFLLGRRFLIDNCLLYRSAGNLVYSQIIQPEIVQCVFRKSEIMGTLHRGMFRIVRNGEGTAVAAIPGKHTGNRQIGVLQVLHAHIFQPKEPVVIRVIHPLRDRIAGNEAHHPPQVVNQDISLRRYHGVIA